MDYFSINLTFRWFKNIQNLPIYLCGSSAGKRSIGFINHQFCRAAVRTTQRRRTYLFCDAFQEVLTAQTKNDVDVDVDVEDEVDDGKLVRPNGLAAT